MCGLSFLGSVHNYTSVHFGLLFDPKLLCQQLHLMILYKLYKQNVHRSVSNDKSSSLL